MKKHHLLGALFALLVTAASATVTTTAWSTETWQLKRGTLSIGDPYPTKAACQAATPVVAEAASQSGNYFCVATSGTRATWTPTPAPCATQPSTSTQTIACAAGLAPPWQQTTTVSVSAPPACTVTTTLTPPTAPANACQPVTPPPTGATIYFSDCQPGAAAGCVAGNNANPGTEASPKQNLGGITGSCGSGPTARTGINCLAAGTTLLFARGGNWGNVSISLDNLTVTATSPLTFTDYTPAWANASTGWPEFRSNVNLFNIGGQYGSTGSAYADGGYTFRNLRLNGVTPNDGSRAFFIHSGTRAIVVDSVEMVNFGIAMEVQNVAPGINDGLTVRNSRIANNSRMGLLGDAINLVFENNVIDSNNFSGSGFNHGVYLGGHGSGVVRGNLFTNNSVVNGVCLGGNFTVHGRWDGLIVENNTILVPMADPGCYGISINDGYSSAEYFRNVEVRGNYIDQTECAICVRAAPDILVENNKVRSNQALASGVVISPPPNADGDDAGLNPTVRNNLFCLANAGAGEPVRINVAGGTATGNVTRREGDASTGACAP